MSNFIVWLIEDSLIARKLLNREFNNCRFLDEPRLIVSENYDEALLHLASLDQESILYVILDCELGDQHKRNGVDLFGLIREKFPSAYIINYSSTPNAFAKAVCDRFSSDSDSYSLFNAVASREICDLTTDDEPKLFKMPALAIEKIKSEIESARDITARLRSDSGYSAQSGITSPRPKNNHQNSVSCCSCWPSLYWPCFSQKKTAKRVYVAPI